jgi:hypothetical protein
MKTYILTTSLDILHRGTELTLGDDGFYYCKNDMNEEVAFREDFVLDNPQFFRLKENDPIDEIKRILSEYKIFSDLKTIKSVYL